MPAHAYPDATTSRTQLKMRLSDSLTAVIDFCIHLPCRHRTHALHA